MKKHTSHPAILTRLKRAHGHLASTISMIENGRECVEVAQQLRAVEKAVGNAKRELVHDHIDHCLDERSDQRANLRELKALTKYLS